MINSEKSERNTKKLRELGEGQRFYCLCADRSGMLWRSAP